MAKMSTKKAITGAVIVMIVWFAIWFLAIRYISKTQKDASYANFMAGTEKFIQTDEAFIQEYGVVSSATEDLKALTANPDSTNGEAYVDITCVTDTGTYRVRIYGYQNTETKEIIYRYAPLPEAE